MILNQQAWAILIEDEKTALSLQHGMDKSSWESGEIMNKSHYKYLEIKYRAEHFLKIFTEHLTVFDTLLPDYLRGDKIALQYFRLCVQQRKKPMAAIELINQQHGRIPKLLLNEKIINTMAKWEKEDDPIGKAAFELIKDFDRWNNFRILPKEIQEPSAFKRRIKNSYKKQIKSIGSIHPIALEKIKKLYEAKSHPFLYLPLLNPTPELIKLKINKGSTNAINTLGLYVFKSKDDANEYITTTFHYLSKTKKECTDGLDFWPKYREIIKKANNYHEVMKISSSRKYLQLAMEKLNYI